MQTYYSTTAARDQPFEFGWVFYIPIFTLQVAQEDSVEVDAACSQVVQKRNC